MKIKDVLKIASMFVNLDKEFEPIFLNQDVDENTEREFDIFVKCLNLTYNELNEYCKLRLVKKINVLDGKIFFSDIDEKFKNLYSVKDKNTLKNVKYLEFDNYISVGNNVKEVFIVYSNNVDELGVDSDISCFNGKISEKCFALGVASEYCYIKSFYTEAEMFDKRFKDLLRICIGKKGNIYLPKRRWR